MTTFFNILENFSANEREQIFREFLRNPGIFWLGQENTGNFETKNNLKGRDNNDRSERRRNCMNTLGGDKTRSRSTFRFFKKIAPTEFKEFKV